MKTGRFGRVGIATLGLAAMVTSGLAIAADAPTELDRLVEQANVNGATALVSVKADAVSVQTLAASFDLTEHGHDGHYDVVAHPGDLARLDALGFEYEVLDPDMARTFYAQRLLERELAEQLSKRGPTDPQPGERIEGYRLWSDFDAETRQLAADNPDFVKLIEFPNKTHEGRTVVGLQIAGDVENAASDGRPSSLLMGLHHAREWPSAELTLMFAYDIIQSYNDGDKEVREIIDNANFYVIPVVNPDGYVRSREGIFPTGTGIGTSDSIVPGPGAQAAVSEFSYHRKNMRPHPSPDGQGLLYQGVDPNRNYPYKWAGGGTSPDNSSATYHGPGPGSEPEIKNVLDLLRGSNVTTLISNHTYSELVLRPFGDTMRDTPDEELIKGHADAMAAINGYDSIKGLELYATTGTTEDWVYGITGAFSYTFEISEPGVVLGNMTPAECAGFHPTYQLCVGDFYKQNRDAFMLNLKQSLNVDWHSRLTGTAPAGTTLTLVKESEFPVSKLVNPETMELDDVDGVDYLPERLEFSMVVGEDGTFTWHVNPSPQPQTILDIEDGFLPADFLETYTLTASLPNGKVVVIDDLLVERGEVYDFAF